MNEQIRQIAMRLRGLRESLDMSVEEAAKACNISSCEYSLYESGESDIPMNFLCNAAQTFGLEPSELVSGDQPNMNNYWLVRKGKGAAVQRQKAYKYQALAFGFKHAKVDPFIVTVEPKDNEDIHLNSHNDQEFNLIMKGTMLLRIGNKDLILNEGDSIYFDANQPHGMKALNGEKARMLAIII